MIKPLGTPEGVDPAMKQNRRLTLNGSVLPLELGEIRPGDVSAGERPADPADGMREIWNARAILRRSHGGA